MFDRYIEELVKADSARKELDAHLQELAKQASSAAELGHFLKTATVGELAKLAGIELPENICTGCGSQMEKLGSIFQCSCGITKKALLIPSSATSALGRGVAESAGGLASRFAGARAARLAPAAQTAAQKAAPLMKGIGGGELTAKELAATQGPLQRAVGGLKQRLLGSGGVPQLKTVTASVKTASFAKFAKAVKATNGDLDKALNQLEKEGYTKLAFNPVQAVKNWGQLARYGVGRAMASSPMAASAIRGAGTGAAMGALTGAVSGGEGNRISGALKGGLAGGLTGGAVGAGGSALSSAMAKGKPGGMLARAGKWTTDMAAKHPTATAGAVGGVTAGLPGMAGVMAASPSKTASVYASLISVGDAAGRLMAKTAADINPEEVAEAVEEAKGREDVPGRARNWGIGGGALGGLTGGALGYAVPRMLGASPWTKGIGAGLGALAGGVGGAYLGSREGAEEAEADRLVSFLRGRRAFGTGANEGYQAGLQQGYLAGLTQGQPMGGEEEAGPQ